jgi:hypothetical protein
MRKVHERVYVGSDDDCKVTGFATVHGCKTCHTNAVGYTGSLPSTHPNYLSLERGGQLYLNLIDPVLPLFKVEIFKVFLEFAKREYEGKAALLTHCNQGFSRGPSLALLFLAKGLGAMNDDSFAAAREDFLKVYPAYNPGKGIEQFLTEHWEEI